MFASNLVAGRVAVELAKAKAKLAVEAADAAEALAQVVIESEADVEDWEDREDAVETFVASDSTGMNVDTYLLRPSYLQPSGAG
jgi:hypothetical protein